jgi:hypothetical protein
MIEEAIQKSSHKPHKTVIWQREQLRWDPVTKENGQRNWQRLVKSARNRGVKADAVPVKSGDGLYISTYRPLTQILLDYFTVLLGYACSLKVWRFPRVLSTSK